MLEAWISAMVYLTCWPLTVSSITRYLIFPSRLTSWPFKSVLGEGGEIAPGVDAVPFGAGFVLALFVLPALAGGKVEDGVVLLVLRGFGFCILSEAADEDDFVEHGVLLLFLKVCPLDAVHACPEGVPSRPTPKASGRDLWKGTTACLGEESAPAKGQNLWRESVRPLGVGALSAAR
jgi:hypothetical protein